MKSNNSSAPSEPAFSIIPRDKEFVERIAGIIPLEAADREALATLIAGHRIMHSSASPSGEMQRQLQLEVTKNLNLHRLVWALVTKLGGTVDIKDSDIPFDWNLDLDPVEEAKALRIVANRCPPPTKPADEQAPQG